VALVVADAVEDVEGLVLGDVDPDGDVVGVGSEGDTVGDADGEEVVVVPDPSDWESVGVADCAVVAPGAGSCPPSGSSTARICSSKAESLDWISSSGTSPISAPNASTSFQTSASSAIASSLNGPSRVTNSCTASA
jgi:hypothetical protein